MARQRSPFPSTRSSAEITVIDSSSDFTHPNQQTFDRLQLSLQLGLRRQIFLAVCDDLAERDRRVTQLAQALAPTVADYPRVVHLTLNAVDPNPIAQISQWLSQSPPPVVQGQRSPMPAFQITGIEQLIRQSSVVQRLFFNYLQNVERSLPRLESSLIFWLSRPWLNMLPQSAPDFWRCRTAVFEFLGDPTPVMGGLPSQGDRPVDISAILPDLTDSESETVDLPASLLAELMTDAGGEQVPPWVAPDQHDQVSDLPLSPNHPVDLPGLPVEEILAEETLAEEISAPLAETEEILPEEIATEEILAEEISARLLEEVALEGFAPGGGATEEDRGTESELDPSDAPLVSDAPMPTVIPAETGIALPLSQEELLKILNHDLTQLTWQTYPESITEELLLNPPPPEEDEAWEHANSTGDRPAWPQEAETEAHNGAYDSLEPSAMNGQTAEPAQDGSDRPDSYADSYPDPYSDPYPANDNDHAFPAPVEDVPAPGSEEDEPDLGNGKTLRWVTTARPHPRQPAPATDTESVLTAQEQEAAPLVSRTSVVQPSRPPQPDPDQMVKEVRKTLQQKLKGVRAASHAVSQQRAAVSVVSRTVEEDHSEEAAHLAIVPDASLPTEQLDPLSLKDQIERLHKQHAPPSLLANAYRTLGNVYRDRIERGLASEADLQSAIQSYEQVLVWLHETSPLWADVLNDLGNLYWMLSRRSPQPGDALGNLQQAVQAYQLALNKINMQTQAASYSMVQSNLGAAYGDLARYQDTAENLQRSIHAYQQALRHRNPQEDAQRYALTQNNLGTTYWNLAQHHQPKVYLKQAIAAYSEALRYYSPETEPLNHAMIQNNLGTAYWNLAQHERPREWLMLALAAYRTALRYRTRQTAPVAYAATQNNLGTAYWHLANHAKDSPDARLDYLQQAIASYKAAVAIAHHLHQDPTAPPLNFDIHATHNNLGLAHYQLGNDGQLSLDSDTRTAHLESALEHHVQALQGWEHRPDLRDATLKCVLQAIRAAYAQSGIAGQNAALSKVPGQYLTELLPQL